MKIVIKREKPKKGAMARGLVYFCMAVLTLTLLWAIALETAVLFRGQSDPVDLADVLTFAGATFGGELLLLAFKRVFAKNVTSGEETL